MADLLLDLHAREHAILVVVTHSAALAARFPDRRRLAAGASSRLMRERTLVARSLVHYRRAHVAVVLGVATAVAVLGGALVVGDSVRASLARTALARLGQATHAVESPRFFREDLASDLLARPAFQSSFTGACPLVALDGVAAHATTGRRAGDVRVYGVDERFWAFQGLAGRRSAPAATPS